jgi:hypothetical protein
MHKQKVAKGHKPAEIYADKERSTWTKTSIKKKAMFKLKIRSKG